MPSLQRGFVYDDAIRLAQEGLDRNASDIGCFVSRAEATMRHHIGLIWGTQARPAGPTRKGVRPLTLSKAPVIVKPHPVLRRRIPTESRYRVGE